jgi:excisionase family DNA binding protein
MSARPFSPETLADRWGCSSDTIRNMCRRGDLRAFRLGRLIRIPAQEVERFECQNTESLSTEINSASPTMTRAEDAFASRLARQTVGSPKLALVNFGGREADHQATR